MRNEQQHRRTARIEWRLAFGAALVVGTLMLATTASAAPAPQEQALSEKGPISGGAVAYARNGQLPESAIDVKVVGMEGDRAVLQIHNRTPFLVLIYIRGIRTGWLRGYRTGLIRGLAVGYHQVYAHSRWGSARWGPRMVWVPSRWTLYR